MNRHGGREHVRVLTSPVSQQTHDQNDRQSFSLTPSLPTRMVPATYAATNYRLRRRLERRISNGTFIASSLFL